MTASVNKPANDVIKKAGKISFSQLQLLLDLNRIIANFELNLSKIVRHASLNQNINLGKRNQTRSNTATKPALKTLQRSSILQSYITIYLSYFQMLQARSAVHNVIRSPISTFKPIFSLDPDRISRGGIS